MIFDISIQLEANGHGLIEFLISGLPLRWKPASAANVHRSYSVLYSDQREFNTGNIGCFLLLAEQQLLFSTTSLEELYNAFESDSRYSVSHELPPARSGERAATYINQGRGLSLLRERKTTTPNYSLNHARSGSDKETASTYPLLIRPLPSKLLRCYPE